MPNRNRGPAHYRWRGGRTVTADGYVLIRVGRGHHLADVRGYAYEHQLVAEQMLGRRLRQGEIVHHGEGGTGDNSPGNLKVVASRHHHAAEHRLRTDLRAPGAPNPLVTCACGCGVPIPKYDGANRPRRYLNGLNGRRAA